MTLKRTTFLSKWCQKLLSFSETAQWYEFLFLYLHRKPPRFRPEASAYYLLKMSRSGS